MVKVREERAFWAHQLHAKVLNSIGAVILQSHVCERAVKGGLPNSIDEVMRLKHMLHQLEGAARSLLLDGSKDPFENVSADTQRTVLEFRERFPSAVLEYSFTGSGHRVPARLAATVNAVLLEAVFNAIKHGHATRIDIDLNVHPGSILLRVRDDGRGFDVRHVGEVSGESPPAHYGLSSMRQLAESAGGNLAISSVPRRGTQVTLHVPWSPSPSVHPKTERRTAKSHSV